MTDPAQGRATSGSGLASLTLHNVATTVADPDVAIAWYERVLGFSLEARGEIAEGEVAVMTGAGIHLELLTPSRLDEPAVRLEPLFADPPRHLLVVGNKFLVFEVEDLARASAELEEMGVTILWREKELAPGWVATARSATATATSSTSSGASERPARSRRASRDRHRRFAGDRRRDR